MGAADDLQERLLGWALKVCESCNIDPAGYTRRDIDAETAELFLAALNNQIAVVDEDEARCSFPSLRKGPSVRLFGTPKAMLKLEWQEFLFQAGLAASFILNDGWPRACVAIDPEPTQRFDVGLYLPGHAQMVIAVEAKRTGREVRALRSQLAAMEGRPKPIGPARDGEKKYLGLFESKPSYLAIAAPGLQFNYRVLHLSDIPKLQPIERLPSFGEIMSAAHSH